MNRYKLHEPKPKIEYLAIGSLVKIEPSIAERWQELRHPHERPYSWFRGVITDINETGVIVRWDHHGTWEIADSVKHRYRLTELVPV